MRVEVEVTEDDIAGGSRYDSCYCPVALALRRVLNRSVTVHTTTVGLNDRTGNVVQRIALPAEVQRFIKHFDNSDLSFFDPAVVQPFKFTLEVPES